MSIVTVRIPELVAAPAPLVGDDRLPIYIGSLDKTRRCTLDDIKDYIYTAPGTVIPPVIAGGTYLYIVPAGDVGNTIASIPSLAGKSFTMRRDGFPLIPETTPSNPASEFSVLNAGGFELLQPGDVLILGQRFELFIYELVAGTPPAPGTGGALLNGVRPVTTNETLTDAIIGKLIQIRANTTKLTITLPDIVDLPENSIVILETSILNTYQAKIQTQGAQNIYMRNGSATFFYMGISESVWLFVGDDGFYVINDFAKVYEDVGKIQQAYKVGLNELVCDGTEKLRADYPRLWEYVQGLGTSLVSEAVWNTSTLLIHAGTPQERTVNSPYRGCFSTGDGSTTFRLPDMRNMGLRMLANFGGVDAERPVNVAGGYQRSEFEGHFHSDLEGDTGSHASSSSALTGFFRWLVNTVGAGNGTVSNSKTGTKGGVETRMDNIGILYVIKS